MQLGATIGTTVPGPRKRLLLVKLGAIGDVIMAIPAAAAMHAAGYQVDWVAGRTVAPVLAQYDWIRVIPVDEASLLRGTGPRRLQQMLALWGTLRDRTSGEAYDLCATLYYDRRYRLLTLPVRARRRVSLSWMEREFSLLPGRHHTDEYARILLGRPDGEVPAQLAPVPVPGLPESPRPRSALPRVVLVPGGARNALRDDALRRWPIENYVSVAEELVQSGCEVVLVGGSEDHWVSPSFAGLASRSGPLQFADLTGTLDMVSTLALMDSAEVTVTHDTGPLHLAGLTSTAIVTLFGPTDPHGRLPHRANSVALWGGESFACRPCYNGRDYADCDHNGCIREITPAMVVAQVKALLQLRGENHCFPPRVLTTADLERTGPGTMVNLKGFGR